MNHRLNSKRFLAAILGVCVGTAALLGVGDASVSKFSRYLLASDGDESAAATSDAGAKAASTSSASSKGRVLKTMEEPSRPMRILKVEESTTLDEDRELIYLKPITASRSLKGTEGPTKGDMLRRVKEIMAHLDQHVESASSDSATRSLHLLQLEFPDCVGLNEKECEATIMRDLEQNEALLTHLGGTTDDLQFEVRPKRHEDDVDHAKVVILTDDSGTKVVGTNGDSIVHYPYKVSEICHAYAVRVRPISIVLLLGLTCSLSISRSGSAPPLLRVYRYIYTRFSHTHVVAHRWRRNCDRSMGLFRWQSSYRRGDLSHPSCAPRMLFDDSCIHWRTM